MADKVGVTAIMCFSGSSGGMELDTIKLADLLSEVCKVVLVCKKDSYIHQSCISSQKLCPCEPVDFSNRTFSPAMLFRVRRIIKKHQIKNVVFFGASELKTLYFAFLGFDLNIIVRHGTTKSSPKHDPVHRLVYSCVDYHVALSRHLLNNVKTIVPANLRAQFRIITSSHPRRQRSQDPKERATRKPLRIIHVGRIADGKGQIEAVKTCAVLDKHNIDFKLDLLGGVEDERYAAQLKAVIEETGLGEKIYLLGHVSDVSTYMVNADILLFPSYGEGMSNVLIESLHYGLVCVCFDNTVFPEFVEMGFHLILAKDRDQSDLDKQMLFAVAHLDSQKTKSEYNKTLAMKYFNVDRERDDWKKILR